MVDPEAVLDCLFLMPCLSHKSTYLTSLALKQSAAQLQQVQERFVSLSSICIVHLVQILPSSMNFKKSCVSYHNMSKLGYYW